MIYELDNKMLFRWLICNCVITICFGLLLALICLFPSCAPPLSTLFINGNMDLLLPYVIFVLVVSAMISMSCYFDSK